MRGAKAPTAQRSAGGVPHRADLATVWLHLDDRDALNEARHCAPMPAARPRPGDQLHLVWRRPARPPAHPATACTHRSGSGSTVMDGPQPHRSAATLTTGDCPRTRSFRVAVHPHPRSDIIDLISEVISVEQILIRNLPPGTKAALRARAEQHHRSVEAEVREILGEVLGREPVTLVDLLGTDEGADIEFEPERLGVTARTAEL